MKKLIASLVFATTSCLALSAQAQQPVDPFTDPAGAIETRQQMHKLMAVHVDDILRIVTGQKQFDGYKLMIRTDLIHQVSQSYYELFMVPGSYEGSKAKPSIATNQDDFKDKIRALEIAAFGTRTAIRNRDVKVAPIAFEKVVKACMDCHMEYMTEPYKVIE